MLSARGCSERLVELDPVAGGIGEEGLKADAFDLPGVLDVDAALTEQVDGGVDVLDGQREVLAPLVGHVQLREVELLAPDLEPRAREVEIGSLELGEPEHIDIEVTRRSGVADIDRDVVNTR
jgi:hypothetical protein